MPTWLLTNPISLAVLKWGAVALSVIAVLFGARMTGRHAERVERLEGQQAAAKERAKAEVQMGGVSDAVLDAYLRPPSRR